MLSYINPYNQLDGPHRSLMIRSFSKWLSNAFKNWRSKLAIRSRAIRSRSKLTPEIRQTPKEIQWMMTQLLPLMGMLFLDRNLHVWFCCYISRAIEFIYSNYLIKGSFAMGVGENVLFQKRCSHYMFPHSVISIKPIFAIYDQTKWVIDIFLHCIFEVFACTSEKLYTVTATKALQSLHSLWGPRTRCPQDATEKVMWSKTKWQEPRRRWYSEGISDGRR